LEHQALQAAKKTLTVFYPKWIFQTSCSKTDPELLSGLGQDIFDPLSQFFWPEGFRDIVIDLGDLAPEHNIDALNFSCNNDHRDIPSLFILF